MLRKHEPLIEALEFESPLTESASFTLAGYKVRGVCVLAKHDMVAVLVSAKRHASVAHADGVHLYSLASGKLQRVIAVRGGVHMCVTHPEADSVLLVIEGKYRVTELFLFGEHVGHGTAVSAGAGTGAGAGAGAGTGAGAGAEARGRAGSEDAAVGTRLSTRFIGNNVVYNPYTIAANRKVIAVGEAWPCDEDRITVPRSWNVPDTTVTDRGHKFTAHHSEHFRYQSQPGLRDVSHTHVALISYADGTLLRRVSFPGIDAMALLPASDHRGDTNLITVSKEDPAGHAVRAIDYTPVDGRLIHGESDANTVAVDVVVRPGHWWSQFTDDPRFKVYVDEQMDYTYYIAYAPGYIAKVASGNGHGQNKIKAIYGAYDGPTRADAGGTVAVDKYNFPIPLFTNVTFNRPENVCMAPDKGLVVHDFDRAGEARVRVLTRPSKLRMDFLSMLVARQRRDS
jgi:hypothetical protein